jgi:hypothetical protein
MGSDTARDTVESAIQLVESGNLRQGKQHYESVKAEAQNLKQEGIECRSYMKKMEDAADLVVRVFDEIDADGDVDWIAEQLKNRLRAQIHRKEAKRTSNSRGDADAAIIYKEGVGGEEKQVTEESVWQVEQDRIEFLEEEEPDLIEELRGVVCDGE